MQRIDWGMGPISHEITPTPQDLVQSRAIAVRNMDICLFSSNLDPTRKRIIMALEKDNQIFKFGRAYSNPVSSKLMTSQNFSMQICNENDLYPGYVTEKLQEAWMSGNLPIWSGLLPTDHAFNLEAFIDVTSMSSEEISQIIGSLTEDEISFRVNQPLMKNVPSLANIKDSLSKIL
jgi:hypothetical protein